MAGEAQPCDPLSSISRRRFLAVGSCCVLCGAGGARRAFAAEPEPVDIGKLSDYPGDVISDKFSPYDFFVIRREDLLYATTALCSHMGNPLLCDPQNATRIRCSGHESVFDSEGRALVGPATQSLARLGISVNAEGRILVDPKRMFSEDQWGDKGCYVALK